MDQVVLPNSLLQQQQQQQQQQEESFLQGQRKRHKSKASPVDHVDGQEYFGSSKTKSGLRFGEQKACFKFKPCLPMLFGEWELPPPNYMSDRSWFDKERRFNRALATHYYRRQCKSVEGRKVCIANNCTYTHPLAKCFHLTWVAVHGLESICMVTWRQALDLEHVLPKYHDYCKEELNMCDFGATVISEVECIPYDDAGYNDDYDFRLRFDGCIKPPFAFVSVVPDTKEVPKRSVSEDSSFEYDVSNATTFLQKKIRSGLESSIEETIVTAISGFQNLCRKQLEAEDIWVTVLTSPPGPVRHLHLDKRKEYLAVIKGALPSCGVGFTSELAPAHYSTFKAVWVYLNSDESSTSESHDQSHPASIQPVSW